jgi:type I restriction enzyme R subunit
MTTKLEGHGTSFLPFNKGRPDGGAGNPPNEEGLKTAYLWEDVLQPTSWDDLITTYVQLEKEKNERGRLLNEQYIFPRYHQRDAVQKMLVDAEQKGAGERYLIQHSTGSGKSYTMTWLAHQLVELTDPMSEETLFDTVIVVTDRVQLDQQIREYLKQVNRTPGVLQPITEGSRQLLRALEAGKKIITTTIQKFPYITDAIDELDQSTFAILIDEAHSSQGGSYTGAMHAALSDVDEEITSHEEAINSLIESRKMLPNASYFAFTATPKEKTLELFGREDQDGRLQPFHEYTMKQAIQEGFIMNVLEDFTHVQSFYKLLKSTEEDVEVVDRELASRKLRHFAETHDYARETKAQIMVDHFIDEVIRRGKVDGKARAMVVTNSREEAIRYFWKIKQYLIEIGQKWRPLVAFSDQIELDGEEHTESSLNGFPSDKIAERFRDPGEPYRFLVVADKFQTGYDEPLLHTMYVDKPLGGVQAVQTLSRLNRTHPEKNDTFVLDFQNTSEEIEDAFSDYYTTTILSERTDPNRLTRLAEQLDEFFVYQRKEVEELTNRYVSGAERDALDPILDRCVERFREQLTEDEKTDFKSKARSFKRTYAFLSQIITFNVSYWERLYWFVKYLLPKLPATTQENRLENVLEHVEMDSYRVQKEAVQTISLGDEEAELKPAATKGGTGTKEPNPDYLSNIVDEFNARFGDIEWTDEDKVRQFIFEELPEDLVTDEAFVEKVRSSDPQNARITVDEKIVEKFQELIMSHTELYKEFTDNPDFQNFVQEAIFQKVYEQS